MQDTPIDTTEMRILEMNTQYLGVSLGMLMQGAGREVARTIIRKEKVRGKHIAILCGPGGNGGDGMVAARHLQEAGAQVAVAYIGAEQTISSTDTLFNWEILKNLHDIERVVLKTESAIKQWNPLQESNIAIDAILGFGVKSKLREPILTAVKAFNKSSAIKYAIDVPTGIDADTGEIHGDAVKADYTITLHAPKPGLLKAKDYVGKLYTVPIGIPPEAECICGPGDVWLFNRPRSASAHKGDFGYSGAPALAGLAALRTGADLVSVLAPESVVTAIRSYSPNLMVSSMGTRILMRESAITVLDAVQGADVLALGPGLGLDKETGATVISIVAELAVTGKPMVIDADGLKSLFSSGIRFDPARSVLTPHWGELEILLDESLGDSTNLKNRMQHCIRAALEFNSVVLLKGPVDVVAHPDGRYKLNRTGVPAMTVGGTGDVLTGIVAALLARGHPAFHAASAAAYISGSAGEKAYSDFGNHITATDCIANIPYAMDEFD
jgi:NAD(P)H-hydrate epimerase